jgi:magnesium-transporting ATPase (P-type)
MDDAAFIPLVLAINTIIGAVQDWQTQANMASL